MSGVVSAGIYVLIGDAAAEAGNIVWLSLLLAAVPGGSTTGA